MKNTITVGSDFSGVGAFDYALKRVAKAKNLNIRSVFACDMDKHARQSYLANHKEPEAYPENVYDRKIPSESLDLYMTSPPCQSFSMAGKRLGTNDDRGILFFNSHKFIKENNPRYFIFENVKGLLSDNGGKTFGEWVRMLGGLSVNGLPVLFPDDDSVPYHLYYKVLNSKKFGVPQSRERIFLIGIRDDSDNNFRFPKEIPLKLRLKDVLEKEIKPKFFLSEKAIAKCQKSTVNKNIQSTPIPETSRTLCAGYHKIPFDGQYLKVSDPIKKPIQEDIICLGGNQKNAAQMINICPTLTEAMGSGGGHVPIMILPLKTQDNQTDKLILAGTLSGGKWDKIHESSRRVYDENGIAPTIPTCSGGNIHPKVITHQFQEMVSVRKFDVNIKSLQDTLKKYKRPTYKVLAKLLGTTKTKVEHWFRTDNYFAIPDAEYWFELKKIMKIETDEFDKSIITFEEKPGQYEKSNRVYDEDGIAPTITSTSADEKILTKGDSKDLEKYYLSKSNIEALEEYNRRQKENNRGFSAKFRDINQTQIMDCLKVGGGGKDDLIKFDESRIRRLTPRECFRLMDFPDTFVFTVSDTQLYRQAGNSIVVSVLEKILNNLNL